MKQFIAAFLSICVLPALLWAQPILDPDPTGGVTAPIVGGVSGGTDTPFTTPSITTGLKDVNGNMWLGQTATTSATQYLVLANDIAAGTPSLTANVPTQVAAGVAGTNVGITASAAIAGSSTAGAVAGGNINLTAGAAARLTSGNANGGNILLTTGAGIGTGTTGLVQVGGTTASFPAFQPSTFSGTHLGIRRADNSNWAELGALELEIMKTGTTQRIVSLRGGAFSSAGGLELTSGGGISWSNSTTESATTINTQLTSEAAATLQLGADSATAVAQTVKGPDGLGTDKVGGDLTLAGGGPTGTALPGAIKLKTAYSTTTGSTVQTSTDREIVAPAKTLTDALTSLFEIALPAGGMTGGTIDWTIEASNGTDHQAYSGITTYASVNKAGAYTNTITQNLSNDAKAVSSGTITCTWAILAGTNKVTIQITPAGSLTETTYRISMIIRQNAPHVITLL